MIEVVIAISILIGFSLGVSGQYYLFLHRKSLKKIISYFELLTESTTTLPIQGFDHAGRIFYWNRGSELTYGYTAKEARGRLLGELILPAADKEIFLQQLEMVYSTKKATAPREGKIITKNGHVRTMYSTMFPYIVQEKITGVFCFDLDTTDIKSFEAELAISYAGYKAIFEGVNEAIFLHDPITRVILDTNPTACEMYGYTRDEFLKLAVEDISGGDNEFVEKKLDALTAKAFCEGPQRFEWLGRHKSGKCFEVEVNLQKGKIGGVDCALAIVRDISQKKRAEEKLRYAEQEKAIILNSLNEYVTYHGPDMSILWANKAVVELLGIPPEQIIGRQCDELWHRKGQACSQCPVKAALVSGEPQSAEVILFNGTVAIVRARPVRDDQGKIIGVVEAALGITERKIAERKLSAAERRYVDLLNHANEMIFSLDRNGVYTSVNAAGKRILGYEEAEMLGKEALDFALPSERESGRNVLLKVVSEEISNSNSEYKCLRKNGQECILRINIWPEYDDTGCLCGVYGSASDITEEKAMIARMRDTVMHIISMLSETVSVADRYTEKHCERLQEFALKIGTKLNLAEQQLEHLKIAALLHDVGKVGIPIHILVKREKLSAEEWEKIKEHPKKGADIVRQLSGYEEVALIIEQHQERADGKGYPRGLAKDQIKKEAAIISVVDAYDAMTSDRPYRSAMSRESAIAELRKHAGSQFDPEVVEVFVNIILSEPEHHAESAQ
ncbi:MAG: PAS domain S-box protein [Candidatus Omnitrophica bacterium]|nr:PAS domain S-box protein [Candidatus Omnitrophota bacterium]